MDTAATHWLDQQDRMVRKMIREYGCFLQYVSGGHGASRGTPFCYTTGLFGLGQPELLVFGLDQLSSAGLLNHVFALVRDGRELVPGEELEFAGHDERYLVEKVPNPGEILLTANRHYAGALVKSVPAYQLTWSVDGAFPWEPGYPYRPESQPRPGTFSALGTDGGDAVTCTCGLH